MYDFRKCVIGVAPTRRDCFPNSRKDEIYACARRLAEKYDVKLVTIQGVADEDLLWRNCDVEPIVKHFRDNGVDAVFVPHANFGQEEAVAKLCKEMAKPVLLWGPRDPAPLGVVDQLEDRAYDVQCGLFATGKALRAYQVPFTYIENCWMDSPILDTGFDAFVRTVCAARAFSEARVAQLSVRPWQFLSVRVNEAELLEKFGIEVTPIESSEILAEIRSVLEKESSAIAAKIAAWKEKIDLSSMDSNIVDRIAAAVIGIRKVA